MAQQDMKRDLDEHVGDHMDVIVQKPTAGALYASRTPAQRGRVPLDREALERLPEEISDPVLALAERCSIWVYALDKGCGVEALNAPLKAYHKPL